MKQSRQISPFDSKAFTCCCCCHVRTGTLIYGIFTVLVHLLLLGLFILAAIHPDVLRSANQQPYDGIVVVQTESGEFFERIGHPSLDERFSKDNLCVAFAMTLAWIMSVLALIYGVARNYASYLMPCFCLQVFDFCLTCLTVVGCFTYAPNIQEWIRQSGLENSPGFKTIECMDRDYVMLLFVTCLIMVLSVKAYLIGMVWSCYKYIQLYVASRSVVREYSVDPDTEMLLPPRYEDAIKTPDNYPQPPAYTSAE
ncbi:lysosomal-associated transmembrane protein 4B [Aplysia californica]|uniref:Lysosomal-associated transmembrane protein 4B n=1 Tax=Aplysia californica TaxID=6500 RepID=A0ABM0K2V6_APLCA|nr:lysosomal-associated transmembrane protein 4B [Aplysia californica]